MVPRVQWNPSFMKVLIILYYDKLTRSVGPVDYIALMEPLPQEQQNYSDCIWSVFGANSGRLEPNKTRHFQSRVGVANVKVGVVKNSRVLYTQNPSLQNPGSATELPFMVYTAQHRVLICMSPPPARAGSDLLQYNL